MKCHALKVVVPKEWLTSHMKLVNLSRAAIFGSTIGLFALVAMGAYAVTGNLPFTANSIEESKIQSSAPVETPSFDPKVDTEEEEAKQLEEQIINSTPTTSSQVRLPKLKFSGEVIDGIFRGVLSVDMNRSNMPLSLILVSVKANGLLEDDSKFRAWVPNSSDYEFNVNINESTEFPIVVDLNTVRDYWRSPDFRPNGLAVKSIDYSEIEISVHPSFMDPEFGLTGQEGISTFVSFE